jgi:hypothetical protein
MDIKLMDPILYTIQTIPKTYPWKDCNFEITSLIFPQVSLNPRYTLQKVTGTYIAVKGILYLFLGGKCEKKLEEIIIQAYFKKQMFCSEII